jgi:S-adenosylmethionine/arginine decarboxylase-like enzyme
MDKNIQRMYTLINAWAMEVALDLIHIDLDIIKNSNELRRYVKELTEMFNLSPYGEANLYNFDDKGYVVTQIMESAFLSGHFVEDKAFINMSVCKPFDMEKVTTFSTEFFKPKGVTVRVFLREQELTKDE